MENEIIQTSNGLCANMELFDENNNQHILYSKFSINGQYIPPSRNNPKEYPEIEILESWIYYKNRCRKIRSNREIDKKLGDIIFNMIYKIM